MSLKDIEKLKERVEKDPNSKLFVPLAEEYRKEGMLDDAIQVLLNGIERQPGYVSARVSLGKMFFDKGMLDEARAEFEEVIKAIPDNLFAHKKLAAIYMATGERDLAKKAYSTVLKLNALDEDAAMSLREIEGSGTSQYKADAPEEADEEKGFPSSLEGTQLPEPPQSIDEPAALMESLSGDESGAGNVHSHKITGEGNILEIADERSEESGEGILLSDIAESFEIPESDFVGSDFFSGETSSQNLPSEAPQKKGLSVEDAGIRIAEGNYLAAIDIYRRILSSDPGNRKALQSVQELKSLLKLMGKDKEIFAARLNTFLDGVKKRRDEFFGSA